MKFIAACIAAVLIAAFWTLPATSQQVVPEQSAFVTACQSARAMAQVANLNMASCRRVAEVVEGNTALVTIKVRISGQGVFFITASYMQSIWGQQSIFVRPA